MAGTNDFLPFCSTDTGTNLLSQSAYASDPQLPIGNQTGVARSMLVNKALRQATYIASCFAQYLANYGNNVFDDATPSEVITSITNTFKKAPTVQTFTSGSGTYTLPTNPSPVYLVVEMVGDGGGGGAASNSSAIPGASGSGCTFGSSFLSAGGGIGGGSGGTPGAGGSASLGSAEGDAIVGTSGGSGQTVAASGGITTHGVGGGGGCSPHFSGGAGMTNGATTGSNGVTNTGGGGAGAGGDNVTAGADGGGSGGYLKAIVNAPSGTYAYSIGAGGTGGAATGGNFGGGNGAAGKIVVWEMY